MEELPTFSSSLYYTYVSKIETYAVDQEFTNHNTFTVWHNRLGHPRTIMMRKIIEKSYGHQMKDQKILLSLMNFHMLLVLKES